MKLLQFWKNISAGYIFTILLILGLRKRRKAPSNQDTGTTRSDGVTSNGTVSPTDTRINNEPDHVTPVGEDTTELKRWGCQQLLPQCSLSKEI